MKKKGPISAVPLLVGLFSVPTGSVAGETSLRDPFRPPVLERSQRTSRSGLEAGALEEYRLVGIIWGTQHPRAMIEDKAGIGYILERGMTVGVAGGRVREIQKDRVIIIEDRLTNLRGLARPREVILTLPKP